MIDLFYFLTTSVNFDVLASSRDELIYAYHEALSTLLENLNYQGYVPSLNEFQVEILKRGTLELYFGLTLAPYLRTPVPNIITAVQPTLYKAEYLQQLLIDGPTALKMNKIFIQGLLKRFDYLGTLDYTADEGRIRGIKSRFSAKV